MFIGVPCAIHLSWIPNWPIPSLAVVGVFGGLYLWRDAEFDRTKLWNWDGMKQAVGPVVVRSLALAFLLGVVVAMFMPDLLFTLVKGKPMLWATVMVMYPIFSVYPQEFLYRTLLFHRYRDLFPSETAMILASATAFGFVHIIFAAWISVALTFVGGLLFALTYARTKSLLLASIEHTLLGNAIFTVGLGQYFLATGARFHL